MNLDDLKQILRDSLSERDVLVQDRIDGDVAFIRDNKLDAVESLAYLEALMQEVHFMMLDKMNELSLLAHCNTDAIYQALKEKYGGNDE